MGMVMPVMLGFESSYFFLSSILDVERLKVLEDKVFYLKTSSNLSFGLGLQIISGIFTCVRILLKLLEMQLMLLFIKLMKQRGCM